LGAFSVGSGPPTAWAKFTRCWPPLQPIEAVQPGMVTHRSRGIDISDADFVSGSMLASMIVSERVPLIGSSSRLSIPSNRMLMRSVPCQSGRTFLTTVTMLLEISAGLVGRLMIGGGFIVTGTLTVTGPAATIITLGGKPGRSVARMARARQLDANTTPKAMPPRTNVQKA